MKLFSHLNSSIEQNPKKAFGLTFLILIAYQMISVFIGFELCDSGFYMTFYDNIFKAPECVEYNFMYYLSGVVGGLFMAIIPGAGIFEMRLLGLANNMIIIYLLYRIFRNHISMSAIIIGTTLVTVSYIAMPMTFYNDLLTSLLYILAIFYLFKGLNNNSSMCFFFSGLIVALNTFARIPNVLDFGIILLIIFHKFYYNETIRLCVNRCFIFTVSFVVGIIGVILFMKVLGHYDYFIKNLRELTSIANDDSGTCSHTVMNMAYAQIRNYYMVLKFGLKVLIPCLIILLSSKYIKKHILLFPLQMIALAALGYFFYKDNPVVPLFAFCLIGSVGTIIFNKDNAIRMLSWAGLSMMIIIPIGSDGGMYNNGSIIYWLAAPMAASFYMSIKDEPIFTIPASAIKRGMALILSVYLLVCGIKTVTGGIYFDGGLLFEKRYSINNDRVRHIYTSKERAQIINDLLVGIQPYVKENDCLFAYGSLPAINYMTRTKPFTGCSWPELLSVQLLKERLNNYSGPLPIILRQKFNSIGMEFGEPSDTYLIDCGMETGHFRSNQKSRIMNEFTLKNNYKTVFENNYFILYLPPDK